MSEVETRRIEQQLIRLTPKEKRSLVKYSKETGIKNVSDWIRQLIFQKIDDDIKNGEFTLF